MKKIRIIIRKEWEEVFKSSVVLWTIVGTPLLLVATAVGSMAMVGQAGDLDADPAEADEIAQFAGAVCDGLEGSACLEAYMGSMMLMMLMLLPAILPGVFAAYSVVGEKTGRTLEPLLATPVSTLELLLGKSLAAVLPGIGATFLAIALYYLSMWFLVSPAGFVALCAPHYLALVLVLGPLLAVLGVQLSLIVSSRVQDPRTAQQVSGLVVLPLVGLLSAQSFGMFSLDLTMVGVGTLLMLCGIGVTTWLSLELFEREAILTRWK